MGLTRFLTRSPLFVAVNSVLAIGGVGGLAVGLAGREILENLFTGLIILSSSPFEVGDEVMFAPPTGNVSPPFPFSFPTNLLYPAFPTEVVQGEVCLIQGIFVPPPLPSTTH